MIVQNKYKQYIESDVLFNKYIGFIIKNDIRSMDEMLQFELRIALETCSMLRDYNAKLKPYDGDSMWYFTFTDVAFLRNMELLTVLSYHRDDTLFAEIQFLPNVGDAFTYIYGELINLKATTKTRLEESSDIHVCCHRHNEMRRLYEKEFLQSRARLRAESQFNA